MIKLKSYHGARLQLNNNNYIKNFDQIDQQENVTNWEQYNNILLGTFILQYIK